MKRIIKYSLLLIALSSYKNTIADDSYSIDVNCDKGERISKAIGNAKPGQKIKIIGYCRESIIITKNALTLEGSSAVIDANGKNAITINGANRLVIRGITVRNGNIGIVGKGAANFDLRNVIVTDNKKNGVQISGNTFLQIINSTVRNNGEDGLNIQDNSSARVTGNLVVDGHPVFGINVINTSSIKFAKANVKILNNAVGMQVGINSSAFIEDSDSTVTANNNQFMGVTAASNSSLFIFGGTLITEHNMRLHGIAIFSSSTFDLDRGAQVITRNNGSDGILLENSFINLFSMPGLAMPKIVSTNNGRHGVNAELDSKIDLSGFGHLTSQNNIKSGIRADNGSYLRITDAIITNNNTDIELTFGSRAEFRSAQANKVSCDSTILLRGEISCPP